MDSWILSEEEEEEEDLKMLEVQNFIGGKTAM